MDDHAKPAGGTIAAISLIMLSLVGCQHPSMSTSEKQSEAWRVLERVGDVRVAGKSGRATSLVRPGETLADDGLVTVDRGALLILAKPGIQLTAGEDTSLRLATDGTGSSLLLDRGWLRVRLATAVNHAARIKTAAFDINASSATLTLRAGEERSDLSIEDGSATLATVDGRHHATLVAGAAARIEEGIDGTLMIRPASGQAFRKVTPLPATNQHQEENHDLTVQAEPDAPSAMAAPPAASRSQERMAILPASRLIKPREHPTNMPAPIEIAGRAPTLAPTAAKAAPAPDVQIQRRQEMTLPETSFVAADRQPNTSIIRQAGTPDPLQQKFDRLTAGLLDGL
ncbi:MAG: hypothetical protein ACR2RA_01805 [Geminicoccaceae bacterium]